MNGRDENGRFVKNHPNFGAGRKSRPYEERLRMILLEEIPPEKFRGLVQTAYQKGIKGDYSFLKLLFDHMIGPPIERKEITGADSQPLLIKVVYSDEITDA